MAVEGADPDPGLLGDRFHRCRRRPGRRTPCGRRRSGARSCAGRRPASACRPRRRDLGTGARVCVVGVTPATHRCGTSPEKSLAKRRHPPYSKWRKLPFELTEYQRKGRSQWLNQPHSRRVAARWRRNPSIPLLVILTAQMMVVLDATIVNVALPHMQRSLHFSSSALSWVLNAYVLTFGGLLLLGARAGDLLGRRRTFLAGIGLFSLSSLAGGLATSGLDAPGRPGRPGRSAGRWPPRPPWPCSRSSSPKEPGRVRAIGLFTTVSAAGGATGLVAGGLLTEWASWRWVMFVNVPIGLAVLAVGRAVLIETERRHGRFDIAGAVTSTAGMTGVVLGLVEAGTDGWSAPITLGSLVAGVALLGRLHPDRGDRRRADPAPAGARRSHPGGGQRRPRSRVRRDVRDGVLPHPVPAGRPAPLGPHHRARVPAHADYGFLDLPAHEPGPDQADPARRCSC